VAAATGFRSRDRDRIGPPAKLAIPPPGKDEVGSRP
jgi:hypothetical protein